MILPETPDTKFDIRKKWSIRKEEQKGWKSNLEGGSNFSISISGMPLTPFSRKWKEAREKK